MVEIICNLYSLKNLPEFIDTKLPNYKKNHVITFLIMCMEKKNAESQDRRNFESVRVLLVIFTRVTTSQACYIFSCALLIRLNTAAFISFFMIRSLKFSNIKRDQQSLEMKIYRTASKSVIKTNGVQKVFSV